MPSRISRTAAAATILAIALSASACNRSERWCEWDQTDEVVANSYCEAGAAGYEWEPDHDHKAKPKPKPKPTTKKKVR